MNDNLDRWDSPLFFLSFEQDTPLKDIATVLTASTKKAKTMISTKKDFLKTGDYLYDLSTSLQSILDHIISSQNSYTSFLGPMTKFMQTIEFPFKEVLPKLVLKRRVPICDLKNFKTQFLKMNQLNAFQDINSASQSFISFIQSYEDDY